MKQESRSESKNNLLRDIVTALVTAWGKDEVARALAAIGTPATSGSQIYDSQHERKARPSRKKMSATDYVAKIHVPAARRELLAEIARRFDQEAFLPTLPDVVHFLHMRGTQPRPVRHRSDAFRQILDTLIDIPDEKLRNLARESSYGGPARLGPLSDAINSASQAIRSGLEETATNFDDSARSTNISRHKP